MHEALADLHGPCGQVVLLCVCWRALVARSVRRTMQVISCTVRANFTQSVQMLSKVAGDTGVHGLHGLAWNVPLNTPLLFFSSTVHKQITQPLYSTWWKLFALTPLPSCECLIMVTRWRNEEAKKLHMFLVTYIFLVSLWLGLKIAHRIKQAKKGNRIGHYKKNDTKWRFFGKISMQ